MVLLLNISESLFNTGTIVLFLNFKVTWVIFLFFFFSWCYKVPKAEAMRQSWFQNEIGKHTLNFPTFKSWWKETVRKLTLKLQVCVLSLKKTILDLGRRSLNSSWGHRSTPFKKNIKCYFSTRNPFLYFSGF